ncbi:beta-L-arabinofuranosidase domain-containing protein [Actinoplanes sp. HUAS TT8]|uniref:beta-L-arabinofuranosidase domain-containing protein n=1 Tax=Actinoplanes sp. HUAS TT8 TaxID=3447453 RepID=UPI003F522645
MIDNSISRRRLIQSAAAVAGATVAGSVVEVPAAAASPTRPRVNGLPVPSAWRAVPFDLDQVALSPSIFTEKRDRILAYARAYPADRILSNFRAAAGLDDLGAQPPGGWDDATGNLRGHYSGHFISMLAQAWAGTGEAVFKDKLDHIVDVLKECQDAWATRVGEPGTPPPAPTWDGGLVLSGDGQYVGLPDATVDGLREFTIVVRVNLAERRTWSRVFDFGTGTTANMFLTVDTGSGPRFAVTVGGSGAEQRISGTTALPENRWVQLAVTLGGGVGTLYVDGAVAGTNPVMTLSPADLGAPKNNWIGRSQYGDALLKGTVGEFHLFSRALTAAEIAAVPSGVHGDLAWYRFDETAGTTVADSSGREWDAAVVTGPGGPPGPSHAGFLAAYPETQFIQLEQFVTYPAIWAPYYTCHKIMRGLLDAHTLTGNATALQIVRGMGDWVHSRLSVLPREQLDRMWGLYIAGEYGGMNEVMADLYALTGDEKFLRTARCFDNTALLASCVADTDALDGRHANQHIPQFLGYLRMFENGAERDYRTAARNFFGMVVPHRTYVHGGIGQGEVFRKRDAIAGTIVNTTNAESCAAYNMLKVARTLFLHAPAASLFDYYEKALVNQILGSRRDADSTTNPLVTYMVPVGPGVRRDFGNIGTCCGGTGLENHTKYQDSIYFASPRGDVLYVNLYIPSTLEWKARGLTVAQTGDYPRSESTTLTITGHGRLDLRLRVPSWATAGFAVKINGKDQRVRGCGADGYVSLTRTWRSGDRVEVAFPYRLHVEPALDDPTLQALMNGPIALIAKSSQPDYVSRSWYGSLPLSGDLGPVPDGFGPFHSGDTDAYHAYFRRSEPSIVFDGQDSGVPNRAGATGSTFLDELWAGAPFATRRTFHRAVDTTARRWEKSGLLSRTEVAAVTAAAGKAYR